jgi:hypothetical protein
LKQTKRHNRRSGSISLLLLVLALFLVSCEDQESKGHLRVLKQLAGATEVYPDFKEVWAYDNHKHGRAILSVYYNSRASYEDVKAFYSKALLAKGWEVYPKERRRGIFHYLSDSALVFRKGEYQIAILRESLDQNPTARNYVISHVWEQP